MISILIPSRGRPDKLAYNIGFAIGKGSGYKLSEFVVRIDEDDPQIRQYELFLGNLPFCKMVVGPRYEGYARNDKLIEECASAATGRILMQLVDTARMETKHWDAILIEKVNNEPKGPYYIMFPSVLPKGSYQYSFPIISRKVYEACGCFCLGKNPSVDRCWEAFSHKLDIVVDSGITIHHQELRNTKDEDQTAKESKPFYKELHRGWAERSAEFQRIGEDYAHIVKGKMEEEGYHVQAAECSD